MTTWLLLALCVSDQAASRPNVVLILADDLAWNDLEKPAHETPHLDRLASDGMRFAQAYAAAPICSSSRAAILTGQSPARLGFEFVTKSDPGRQPIDGTSLLAPPYALDPPERETTIAETLSAAGYRTAFFGKWHVERHHGRYLGWNPERGPTHHGFAVAEEDFGSHPYNPGSGGWTLADGEYPGDGLTDRAVRFVREMSEIQTHAENAPPFFLMVSHFYVHTPVRPRVDWLLADIRRRFPDLPEPRVRYAAFVRMLDHYVGQLLDAIDAAGLRESTLVAFTSDNGGDPRFADHGPLRGHKWSLYEGGVRVPLVIRWPGVAPAGAVCDEPAIGTDLLPTFAEAADAETPTVDGVSLLPLLRDPGAPQPSRAMLWHFPYYHPESNVPRDAEGVPTIESAGIDDGRAPFLEPHAALRFGDEKIVHLFQTGRTEGYRFAKGGAIDEMTPLDWSAEQEAAARERILNELRSRGARLPERRERTSAN